LAGAISRISYERAIVAILDVIRGTISGPPTDQTRWRGCAGAFALASGTIDSSDFRRSQGMIEGFYLIDLAAPEKSTNVPPDEVIVSAR
jgi:hypothetical protein